MLIGRFRPTKRLAPCYPTYRITAPRSRYTSPRGILPSCCMCLHPPLRAAVLCVGQIANKQRDLKKKLKVTFAGEPGLDMGGLTKEWFMLIIRKVFDVSVTGPGTHSS